MGVVNIRPAQPGDFWTYRAGQHHELCNRYIPRVHVGQQLLPIVEPEDLSHLLFCIRKVFTGTVLLLVLEWAKEDSFFASTYKIGRVSGFLVFCYSISFSIRSSLNINIVLTTTVAVLWRVTFWKTVSWDLPFALPRWSSDIRRKAYLRDKNNFNRRRSWIEWTWFAG